MIWIRNWLFILTLLTGGSVYAEDTCHALFRLEGPEIDVRYGQTSQNDDYLQIQGLIKNSNSQLCGPTCIANGFRKFHRLLGHRPELNGPQFIERLVRKFFAASVIEKGAESPDMADAIRKAFTDSDLRGHVHLFSNVRSGVPFEGPIRDDYLRAALRDDTFVIAGLGRYSAESAFDAAYTNRTSAHYVLIAGYNPDVPSEFYVVDPLSPREFRRVEVTRVWSDRRVHETLRFRFTDGTEKSPTILLEDLLVVRRTP